MGIWSFVQSIVLMCPVSTAIMVRKSKFLPLLLAIKPAMADPVLKVMRQSLGRAFLPAVFLITVGGLFIDSFTESISRSGAVSCFLHPDGPLHCLHFEACEEIRPQNRNSDGNRCRHSFKSGAFCIHGPVDLTFYDLA